MIKYALKIYLEVI